MGEIMLKTLCENVVLCFFVPFAPLVGVMSHGGVSGSEVALDFGR